MGEGVAADGELEEKPHAEVEPGSHGQEEDREDPGENSGTREEDQVAAEHAGNRAARPDLRDRGLRGGAEVERHPCLQGARGQACREVEEQIADPPERVLHVVPEDPEKQHVHGDVVPPAVREHGRHRVRRPGQAGRGAGPVDLTGLVAELVDRPVDVGHLVGEPDGDVHADEGDGDRRERSGGQLVLERKHVRLRQVGLP
jgi:hypothetical protein